MTTRPTRPKRYLIRTLLENGEQPFGDLDDDTMDALTAGLKDRKALTIPIILSRDGVLLDGHQRLKAELRNGKTYISAEDIRFEERATAETALEWAVRLNMVRRHLTPEDKGKAARRLQKQNGWSQRKLAEFFGVSQPAVSQWLATQDEDDGPSETIGLDGKTYRRRPRRSPQHPAAPGLPDWIAMAGQLVTMIPVHWAEVPKMYRPEARDVLADLAEAIAGQLARDDEEGEADSF